MIIETKMKFKELPNYIRFAYPNKSKGGYCYKFGIVKDCSNPYAFTEEKQMQGHFGIALKISLVGERCIFVRDDGTVWKVYLDNFVTVEKIIIEREV